MISLNHFRDKLADGRIYDQWQADNGMYQAQITGLDGLVESAIVCKTPAQCHKWLDDHEQPLEFLSLDQVTAKIGVGVWYGCDSDRPCFSTCKDHPDCYKK